MNRDENGTMIRRAPLSRLGGRDAAGNRTGGRLGRGDATLLALSALSVLLGGGAASAEEQVALVSAGPAPPGRFDELGRGVWTALPPVSVAGITPVSGGTGLTEARDGGWQGLQAYSLGDAERAEGGPLWSHGAEVVAAPSAARRVAGTGSWASSERPDGLRGRRTFAGLDLDFSGRYGRLPNPVRDGLSVIEEPKRLRWSAIVEAGGWKLGGALGNKANPARPTEELSWSALARYDRGPVSLGLVYSYTLDQDASGAARADVLGTLQGGLSYAVTTRVSASLNLAYWDSRDDYGRTEAALGALAGIAWEF